MESHHWVEVVCPYSEVARTLASDRLADLTVGTVEQGLDCRLQRPAGENSLLFPVSPGMPISSVDS